MCVYIYTFFQSASFQRKRNTLTLSTSFALLLNQRLTTFPHNRIYGAHFFRSLLFVNVCCWSKVFRSFIYSWDSMLYIPINLPCYEWTFIYTWREKTTAEEEERKKFVNKNSLHSFIFVHILLVCMFLWSDMIYDTDRAIDKKKVLSRIKMWDEEGTTPELNELP